MTWSAEHAGASGLPLRWLLVVEGLPYVWTSEDGADSCFTRQDSSGQPDAAVTTWFGAANLGGRLVRAGLDLPSVGAAIDELTGGVRSDQVTFRIRDLDGSLALLFGREPTESTTRVLGETIPAGSAALASSIITRDGTPAGSTVDPAGRSIGIEYIGPARERNYRPHLPVSMPGPRHHAPDPDHDNAALPVLITDEPAVFEGRRVTLWAVWPDRDAQDHSTATNWGTWEQHFASERSLVWWGKLRDRPSLGADRVWEMPCVGPASWLDRQLNVGPWHDWRPVVQGSLTLATEERGLAIRWEREEYTGAQAQYEGARWRDADRVPISGTAAEYREWINDRLEVVAAGDGNTFTSAAGNFADYEYYGGRYNSFVLSPDGAELRCAEWDGVNAHDYPRPHLASIVLHRKVWALLGYNVDAHLLPDGPAAGGNGFYPYEEGRWWDLSVAGMAAPGDDYYELELRTHRHAGVATYSVDVVGGAQLAGAGSTLVVGLPAGQRSMLSGQHLWSPSAAPVLTDGTNSYTPDRSRVFMLRGTMILPGHDDADEHTFAFVGEWRDSPTYPGTMQEHDNGLGALLYVRRWLDPSLFGLDTPTMGQLFGAANPVLSAQDLEAVPLGLMPRESDAQDRGYRLGLLGTMATTGTSAGWSAGALDTGENVIETAAWNDRESYEHGLGIPAEMIDEWGIESAMRSAGCVSGPLAWWRYARVGPYSSREAIDSLVSGAGLAWSLHGSRYGLFDRFAVPGHDEVVLDILQEDTRPPRQDTPLGRFTEARLELRADPEGQTTETIRIQARDRGAAHRPRTIHTVRDDGAIVRDSLRYWLDQRWAEQAATFWGRRMFVARGVTVPTDYALQLRPGSVVRLTHPALLDIATGTYGVTGALCRVLSWRLDGGARATLDLLVYSTAVTAEPVWAPWGLSTRRGYDQTARTLQLERDPWGLGDAAPDPTLGWVRPTWAAALGGAAGLEVVLVEQDRGALHPEGPTGTVQSVDSSACRITFTSAGLSSTPKRDTTYYVVPRVYSTQPAWAQALYGWVTLPGGTHSSGTQGRELRD